MVTYLVTLRQTFRVNIKNNLNNKHEKPSWSEK